MTEKPSIHRFTPHYRSQSLVLFENDGETKSSSSRVPAHVVIKVYSCLLPVNAPDYVDAVMDFSCLYALYALVP